MKIESGRMLTNEIWFRSPEEEQLLGFYNSLRLYYIQFERCFETI